MRRVALACVILMSLSGCASLPNGTTTALQHRGDFDAAAQDLLEAPTFIGIAGFDGHVDLERFEKEAREGLDDAGEDPAVFDEFDLRFTNGEPGDGHAGTWFAAYFDMEDDAALLLQATPDGMNHHVFAADDTRADDDTEATDAFALAMSMMQLPLPSDPSSAGCSEEYATSLPADVIDSDRAAAIAMDQQVFRDHTEAFPEGDFVYVLVPGWEFCFDGITDTEPAVWAVAHVDLDAVLDEDWANATVAYAIMDAESGDVMDVDVDGQTTVTELYDRFPIEGGLLPPPLGEAAHGSYDLDVPAGTVELDMWLWATKGGADFVVTDPAGTVHDHDMEMGEGDLAYWIEDPVPGTWHIDASFDQLPGETREGTIEAYMYANAA